MLRRNPNQRSFTSTFIVTFALSIVVEFFLPTLCYAPCLSLIVGDSIDRQDLLALGMLLRFKLV